MITRTDHGPIYRVRMWNKDLGVALVVLLALGLGWLLRWQVESQTISFSDSNSPFQISYPSGWVATDELNDLVLNVSDPQTRSPVKTQLTVETRELDPASPPTLPALRDRRVEQRAVATGYRFLNEGEAQIDGAPALWIEDVAVVQPIDEPRRLSLPVVVRTREYIIVTAERSFYISLSAPEQEFAAASARFEHILRTVQVQ
jgi:hypothetical protein